MVTSKILFLILLYFTIPVDAQVYTQQVAAGEYLIKFKDKKFLNSLTSAKMLGIGITVKTVFAGSEIMHVKVDADSALQPLYDRTDIEFIEPNYQIRISSVAVSESNTEDAIESYSLSNSALQVHESWTIQKPPNEGTKPIVAVIDTGLDINHPLFRDSNSVWQNTEEINGRAGVDDDGNGYIDDYYGWNFCNNRLDNTDDHGHGTHVAGIVLGIGQDIFASPIMESKIKIMALKFIDASGAGYAAGAINAIYYAVNNGAKVINNSWGGQSKSRALAEAYVYAYKHGVVIVSAAGNSNENNDISPFYPANFDTPNNIAVLATADDDKKAWFSNYGPVTVAIGAPGVAILSAVPNNSFQIMSGTSMAAPFVAGLAALVSRESPQLSAFQIKNIVMDSVDLIPDLLIKVKSGGRANALNAIILAKTQSNILPWAPAYELPPKVPAVNPFVPADIGCGAIDSSSDRNYHNNSLLIITLLFLPVIVALRLQARPPAFQLSA